MKTFVLLYRELYKLQNDIKILKKYWWFLSIDRWILITL